MAVQIGTGYCVLFVLAIACRYLLGLSQGCLEVGKAISDQMPKRGFQDAVTPPWSTNVTILVWLLSAMSVVAQFYYNGTSHGIGGAVMYIVVMILVGAAIIPKPESPYWVRLIYGSLARRTADYAKKGDAMRSDATSVLRRRIEERLLDKLAE